MMELHAYHALCCNPFREYHSGGVHDHCNAEQMLCKRRRAPPLVAREVMCPCGRRLAHPVVPEGAPPPALACDGECARAARQARLASAFGIARPAEHVPWVDRHRCGTLISFVWHVGASSAFGNARRLSTWHGSAADGAALWYPEVMGQGSYTLRW